MRVLQIYPQNKINNSPMNARTHKNCDSFSFKSWVRERYLKTGFNRNNTCFFRDGDFIKNLTDMLSEKFKDIPKVNVYCFGCSDGSEALSFIMNMLANTKEINPQKIPERRYKSVNSFEPTTFSMAEPKISNPITLNKTC